jgi:predicted transcriptional regulator
MRIQQLRVTDGEETDSSVLIENHITECRWKRFHFARWHSPLLSSLALLLIPTEVVTESFSTYYFYARFFDAFFRMEISIE